MNEKTLRILEYHKIIEMLSKQASTSLGMELCANLMPSTEIYEVKDRLLETGEAVEMVLKWGSLPIEGASNIKDIIKRVKMGYVLTPRELLKCCDILRCGRRLKSFMGEGNKKEIYPIISEIVELLGCNKNLEEAIEGAIISEEEISDKASQKLFNIRRSIKDKNLRVKDKLQSMLSGYGKYLQDSLVTLREGRYVIPVKAECKGSVPGLVHDQSASGSTLFIEPLPVVELNNEIRELLLKEKEEIERILMELTGKVEENLVILEANNENIGYLDFLMAKGKLGLDMNGAIPEINEKGVVNIRSARHPLIDKDKVVPIDIKLGETYRGLVITGPNTGGKTVTLKTTGLLSLMSMAGLAIPALSGCKVSIFKKVFADIGDEQSIEQSLSTFSSHMTNIVDILKNVNERSLVLVDELGAGTDPMEGAALAMAILKKLYEKKAMIVATTHYSEIKVFAMEEEGFENASVEFNIETLSPTYRLLIGIPGKSNAFEISKRLGLDNEVINSARELISKDAEKFEDVIQNLQHKTALLDEELSEIEKVKAETLSIKRELSEKKFNLESSREKILKESRDEAKRMVRAARDEADNIVKELIDMKTRTKEEISLKDAEEARKKLRDKLNEIEDSGKEIVKEDLPLVKDVKIGDEVFVTSLSQKGTVITEKDDRGEVMVQMGIMKVSVPLDKLRKAGKAEKKGHKNQSVKIISKKNLEISSSIDLRGNTIDEAIFLLDKYLDDAFLAGLERVNIIHGKGTGALREGLKDYLKRHRYVKSMRLGDLSEGGSGVTVVEIKR